MPARVGPVELWRDPQAAVEALLERYALQVRVGQLVGRFVPAAVVDPGQGVTGEEVEELFVSAFVRPLEDGRVQYAWVFALDMRSYRSSVRARRS